MQLNFLSSYSQFHYSMLYVYVRSTSLVFQYVYTYFGSISIDITMCKLQTPFSVIKLQQNVLFAFILLYTNIDEIFLSFYLAERVFRVVFFYVSGCFSSANLFEIVLKIYAVWFRDAVLLQSCWSVESASI